jgi:hypothetical protein
MMTQETTPDAQTLLVRLREFLMPGGLESVRSIRNVRFAERGEMRSAPEAPWIPFSAEETIDTTRSGFCWQARLRSSRIQTVVVTDAYEEGHGRLVAKLGGLIPVANFHGPEYDKGEIQRYLASALQCPPILFNHKTLEFTAVGPATLRLRDRMDPTDAAVDLDIAENGSPAGGRAERPRAVGKRTILTPWSAKCGDFLDREGLRIPSWTEAIWHFPEGPFTYYKSEITSYALQR